MSVPPIAFFAFNRPKHTLKALESLIPNPEIKETDLYFFIDGPRNPKDQEGIEEVLSVIKSKSWAKNCSIHQSKENRGCANQVIEAVGWLCREKGRAIIVEDDNLLSPHFLNYMHKALDLYSDEEKVMDISGYMYPAGLLSVEAGFVRGGANWGWGTWHRAWKLFEPDARKLFAMLTDKKMEYEFNFRGTNNFMRGLNNQIVGKADSWSIRWYANMFLRGGLTLFPAKSLTQNVGFDGTGIHGSFTTKYNTDILRKPITQFPKVIEESEEMLLATIKYFRSNLSLRRRVWDRTLSLLKGKF